MVFKNDNDKNNNDTLIFLNSPIDDFEADIIGMKPYVEQLDTAVDKGAQMIAVTSPFGAGKSSLIELFRRSSKNRFRDDICGILNKYFGIFSPKKVLIEVSMWNQNHERNNNLDAINLHKTFLYQLASQINRNTGTYINRRLSKNYGLLALHTRGRCSRFFACIAVIFLVMIAVLSFFKDTVIAIFPQIQNSITMIKLILTCGAGCIGIFILVGSGIVFSSKRSEGSREADIDEIIDLYRSEILKKSIIRKHFIVIIEDLDRSAMLKDAVIPFLKELRRYCCQRGEDDHCQNKITFIVNIMPEAMLKRMSGIEPNEFDKDKWPYVNSLYAKLFDYILDLSTINIDNYDSILEGLLDKNKDDIERLGLSNDGKLINIPGMQWIIREPKLGMREIKDRLNKAFLLYASLVKKFNQNGVLFERCAMAAYLTTAYEEDFSKTQDRAFDKLIKSFVKNKKITVEECEDILENCSEGYASTICDLIENKLIDDTYRMYFYNYPKNSHLYNVDEQKVMRAILYNEFSDDLDEAARNVIDSGSDVIKESLGKIEKLDISLPDTVFFTESIYIEALRFSPHKIKNKIRNLNFAENNIDDTLKMLIRLLSYDANRNVYNGDMAEEFCKIWDTSIVSDVSFIKLRSALCKAFPQEILWYEEMFFAGNILITEDEMESLTIFDAISLINIENEDFSIEIVNYILERYKKEIDRNTDALNITYKVSEFFSRAEKYVSNEEMAEILLDFMNFSSSVGIYHQINPEFEQIVCEQITNEEVTKEARDKLLKGYKKLLCGLCDDGAKLELQTLNYISEFDDYDGYSEKIVSQLYDNGYYLEYTLMSNSLHKPVPYDDENILEDIRKNIEWLINKGDIFVRLRLDVVNRANSILRYKFLFAEECGIMTVEELNTIIKRFGNSDSLLMDLIAPSMVTKEISEQLIKFFNRKTHKNNEIYEILCYISKFPDEIISECFDQIDFNQIKYKKLSHNKKEQIKEVFFKSLALDMAENKLYFMEKTGYLESEWEKDILSDLNDNNDIQKRYVKLINDDKSELSNETVNVYSRLNSYYKVSKKILTELFKKGYYKAYIISKTLTDGVFTINGENDSVLWKEYVSIFESGKYPVTRKHMAKNIDFLNKLISEHEYRNMTDESLLLLNNTFQDKGIISEVFERGRLFFIKYFSGVKGFKDIESAEYFMTMVLADKEILLSDVLYNYIHGTKGLISSVLKQKYTRARKKA